MPASEVLLLFWPILQRLCRAMQLGLGLLYNVIRSSKCSWRLRGIRPVSSAPYLSVECIVFDVAKAADDARLQCTPVDVHIGGIEPLIRLGVVTLYLGDGEASYNVRTEGF